MKRFTIAVLLTLTTITTMAGPLLKPVGTITCAGVKSLNKQLVTVKHDYGQSGQFYANTKAELKNQSTGVMTTLTTNTNGNYSTVLSLTPGQLYAFVLTGASGAIIADGTYPNMIVAAPSCRLVINDKASSVSIDKSLLAVEPKGDSHVLDDAAIVRDKQSRTTNGH